MQKKDLIRIFTEHLIEELKTITAAAQATYEAATHEESKAENQYDTRGLEASYLAGAQAKRVQEIKDVLGLFQTLTFKDFTNKDTVQSTALVEIELDGKKSHILVMPKGGGVQLEYEKQMIQIVTPASHLGESILGLRVGENTEFEVGHKVRVCEILSLQ